MCIHCLIALGFMPQNLTDEKSTLVQVMAWYCKAIIYHLSQCWSRYSSPYAVYHLATLIWYILNLIRTLCMHQSNGFRVCHSQRNMMQYITMTSLWARWCLKSPASLLFAQPFIRAHTKENIKAPRYWPFVREIHWWQVNSLDKGPVKRKMFPFDDVIMRNIVWSCDVVSQASWCHCNGLAITILPQNMFTVANYHKPICIQVLVGQYGFITTRHAKGWF